MKKTCPKCGKTFECVHSKDCWCAKVTLDEKARIRLTGYKDCLCKECLEEIAVASR